MSRPDPVGPTAVEAVVALLAELPAPVPPAEVRSRWIAAVERAATAPPGPAAGQPSRRRVAAAAAAATTAAALAALAASALLLGTVPAEPSLPAQLTDGRPMVAKTTRTGITVPR